MTDLQTRTLLEQLDDLVQEERDALLQGHLDSISDILARKEAMIDALAELHPPRDALERLQEHMNRNQALFDKTLEGIRNVANRLSALRRLRKSLDTYDEHGRKTEMADPQASRLERRA